MISTLKFIVIIILCGTLINLFLINFYSFLTYQITGQIFIAEQQSIVPTDQNADANGSGTDKIVELLNASPDSMQNMTLDASELSFNLSSENITEYDAMFNLFGKLRMIGQNASLQPCPATPPGLVGPIKVWFDEPSFEQLEEVYSYLEPGGHGKPRDCRSRHRVAIILPYRDREHHLRTFLHNLHSLLTKQQLDYAIFVVEQIQNETFNRAKLMNIGFHEANQLYDFQCYVFHDVDLYPEDDRNIYSCPVQPRHMSVAVDKFKYKLPYRWLVGGAIAITKEQFLKVNGFSNDYWGWGGEDDDLSKRLSLSGLTISRYPANIARYKMMKHSKEKGNPSNECRRRMMTKTKERYKFDGFSSLQYVRHKRELLPLFTRIEVELLEEQSRNRLHVDGFPNC